MDITSVANPRIKRLIALRERKERDRESLFLVEGSRDLDRAVAHGHRPLEIYYDPARFSAPPHRAEAEASVTAEALDRASYRGRSQGVIGVFGQFDVTLDHLTPGPDPLLSDRRGDREAGEPWRLAPHCRRRGGRRIDRRGPSNRSFQPERGASIDRRDLLGAAGRRPPR